MLASDEACVLEVLDEQTLQPVADGEKGELVVTSLTREGLPILRFRTGDLTLKDSTNGNLLLPRGVFGRTDSMIKVKGVKVYPRELLFILVATEGLNFRNYQLCIRHNQAGTDHVQLKIERTHEVPDNEIDIQQLEQRIRHAPGISMNEIKLEPSIKGPLVDDQRYLNTTKR